MYQHLLKYKFNLIFVEVFKNINVLINFVFVAIKWSSLKLILFSLTFYR